ncbi:MAG: DNA primase catalytic subunit PriS [Candidatus Micrarchaeota archaeon]
MNEQERQIIIKRFADYYSTASFGIPFIENREFGIGNRKKIDARHLSFFSEDDFKRYLAQNTPLFVSHSIAYYEFPGATPIQKKQRTGADLVFDLDIHAEGKFGAYEKLDEVKEDAIRLVDEFIVGDFAVDRKNVKIAFSGNRGYHIHVTDVRFRNIGGDERREIVDYIKGNGLDYMQFFTEEEIGPRLKKLTGPRPDESGYRGRLARAVIRTLKEKPAILSRKFSKENERELFISGINEGNWSKTTFRSSELLKRLEKVTEALPVRAVDTDAAVTHDLSKLIRVPNSIHGDTGLVARVVDDIGKFEPFRDAVMQSNDSMKVIFTEDVPELRYMDGTAEAYKKGDVASVPEPLAIFYILKGCATNSI